jgi:SagB-type dehydrogenase family enzyme
MGDHEGAMEMMHNRWLKRIELSLPIVLLAFPVSGAGAKDISLPKRPAAVQSDLVNALENRKSVRDYTTARLNLQDLSAILWAANGVNRDYGRRTAPSAFGNEYIDIYVVSDEGAWRYDASAHRLKAAAPAGLKERLTGQRFVGRASHVLVLVADPGKYPGFFASGEERLRWAHATAGAIAQNVYLMSAARGVGTCLVAGIDEGAIRKGLGLAADAMPLYVMPLGYEER